MNRWLLLTLVLAALSLAVALGVYQGVLGQLPERVPTHWGLDGRPDAFTPRERMLPQLLLPPGLLFGWVLLTLALPWLSPRPFSVEGFRPTYAYLMALVGVFFAYLQAVILAGYFGRDVDMGKGILLGVLGLFALLGTSLGKVRRNFWIGVRTPWTLASDLVWERTHRLAGWLMGVGGAVGVVALLAGAPGTSAWPSCWLPRCCPWFTRSSSTNASSAPISWTYPSPGRRKGVRAGNTAGPVGRPHGVHQRPEHVHLVLEQVADQQVGHAAPSGAGAGGRSGRS